MTNLPAPRSASAEPARRPRHDGWTPDRQRRFVEALADCGSVGEAATRAGMSKQSAYTLRRHPAAADFRAGWDAALADAWRRIEETALERAIGGETDIYDRDGFQIIRHAPAHRNCSSTCSTAPIAPAPQRKRWMYARPKTVRKRVQHWRRPNRSTPKASPCAVLPRSPATLSTGRMWLLMKLRNRREAVNFVNFPLPLRERARDAEGGPGRGVQVGS